MTPNKRKFYLSKFKGHTFVLKIGGEVIKSKKILEGILKDIVEMMELGIKIVLVHGGGTQADDLSAQLGHTPQKLNGRRVTGEKDLEVVKMLYGGTLNLEILSILKRLGAHGMRVSGVDGGLLNVEMRPKNEFDYGFVGDVESVDSTVLKNLFKDGYLPVVSPLGVTEDGTIVNINADTVATEIAISLNADKLILFTNVDGVYDGEKLLRTLNESDAYDAIKCGIVKGGMAVKVENCIYAVKEEVKRVHILNGLSPHSLLNEVLSKKGVGTMFVSDSELNEYLNE